MSMSSHRRPLRSSSAASAKSNRLQYPQVAIQAAARPATKRVTPQTTKMATKETHSSQFVRSTGCRYKPSGKEITATVRNVIPAITSAPRMFHVARMKHPNTIAMTPATKTPGHIAIPPTDGTP
jgi:hypothetical protein